MKAPIVGLLLLALGGSLSPADPVSDEEMRLFPGKTLGSVRTYWHAPFVKVSECEVGAKAETTVTWYGEDGGVTTRRVYNVQPGYVTTMDHGRETIRGVNETWEFVLPKEIDANDAMAIGFVHSTLDSSTFVYEFSPDHKNFSLDIFLHGKFVRQAGPFLSHGPTELELGESGSMALLTWKDATEESSQLVLIDPAQKVDLRIDCDNTDAPPIPAPDGAGVLLPGPGASDLADTFTWYTREGKVRSMQVAPHGQCLGWVPATQKSLFYLDLGSDSHYRMIDWATGDELWDIARPGNGERLAIAITSRLVIFVVAERLKSSAASGPAADSPLSGPLGYQAFYAVNVSDGKPVAHWRALHPQTLRISGFQRFVRRGNRLFYVMGDGFLELSEDDILNARDGWQR